MDRAERAVEYKKSYNCAQAVMLAFEDEAGLSRDMLLKLGSGFGLGMGCMEGTCGALVGAVAVAGLKNNGDILTKNIAKDVLKNFENRCGSTICKELKGVDTGKVLCPCSECVRNAVLALEEEMPR